MDSSLLLLPLARQRLLQALALGIPPQAFADGLVPALACNSLFPSAAATVDVAPSQAAQQVSLAPAGEWTSQEDNLLKSLIAEHGTSKWSRIAVKMGTKSNRQCRRRWQAILNSMGTKGSWTAEEDAKLVEGHRRFGNRWTDIARLVPGRTDNAVKNRFAALVAKGEGVRGPKVQRWSDVCVVPKAVAAGPVLDDAGEESCPTPASRSAVSSLSCPSAKRKAACVEAADLLPKRMKPMFPLDLNTAPESDCCQGWLASDSEPASSEISCTESDSGSESCSFDLNSPARA